MAIDPTGLKPGLGAVRGGIGSAPAADRLQLDARVRVGALAVGQEVGARVLADTAAGRYAVLLDGRPVVLQLPVAVAAGEALRLSVIARDPALVLAPREGGGRVASAAATEAASPTLAEPAVDEGAGGSEVVVSPGARALARLIAGIGAAASAPTGAVSAASRPGVRPEATLGVVARTLVPAPTVNEPDTLVATLSRALSEAMGASGLFYESHQAQWVAGARSLDTLRAEPQGQRAPLAEVRAGQSGNEARESRSPLTGVAGGSAPAGGLEGRVDPALAPLVQQQLGVLESRVLPWSGWAFPGVPLRIDLQEPQEEGGGDAGPASAADWATRLRVELPRLGAVEARLLVRGERIVLSVVADSPVARAEMGAAREALAGRLEAAGLRVDALEVRST